MIALQGTASLVWLAMMLWMTGSLWRVFTGQTKGNDKIWAVMWMLALNRFCFNFTAIAIPGVDAIRAINYICSIGGAALLFGVAKSER